MDPIPTVEQVMTEFAESTGLSTSEASPRRYLWTDAFAVCNFLELHRLTGNEDWRKFALDLVDQVHRVLGRHRDDDPRTGWISGLSEEEGERHPTVGGLRIGKSMNERQPSEPYDDHLEWDRDGQYYHYLTKWMHALDQVSRATENLAYNFQAVELAKAVHAAFVQHSPSGPQRMFWKMSIDLSYPLVPSMGQHDPLDGFITYRQLKTTALEIFNASSPDLDKEIKDMESLCSGMDWTTADPLGIGGLLTDAYRVFQMMGKGRFKKTGLLNDLLKASSKGLDSVVQNRSMKLPADYRLAFRELGMAIGLHAVEGMKQWVAKGLEGFPENQTLRSQIQRLERYVRFGDSIEAFWLDPRNRKSSTWRDHQAINSVMLVTSLIPGGYLNIGD